MDSFYLNRIKNFEGYTREAKWDYAQYSNGYGTRAAFPGEVIDKAEAERRFRDEISRAAALVDEFAPGLDTGSRAALTSLTFNAGTKWMRSGLGEAIKSGDLDEAKSIFLKYTKAGGADLPGLVNRRLEEVAWFQDAILLSPDLRNRQDSAAVVAAGPNHDPGTAAPSELIQAEKHSRSTPDPIAAAHDLFQQLEMDRVRLLVLGERSGGSERKGRDVG